MRLILISFLSFLYANAMAIDSKEKASHTIELIGKVGAINSSLAIPAKIFVQAKNLEITVNTDAEGKFHTYFSAVSTFKVSIQSSGFEPQDQDFSVPELKSDSTINITASLIPVEKLRLSGMIFDKKTSKPMAAEFDLYLDTDIVKEDVEIIADGKYDEKLTNFGWYIIDISARDYLDLTDTVWVTDCGRSSLHRDYYLTPIEVGITVQLKNIQFNFGKTSLHESSFEELNDVAEWLTKNPTLKLEIGGHTDSDGPDDYNLWLSQSRAQAVVDYLISHGVNSAQLTAKGYGETKPLDKRETLQAKSANRRVEFTVLQH